MFKTIYRLYSRLKKNVVNSAEIRQRQYFINGDYKNWLLDLVSHSSREIEKVTGLPIEFRQNFKRILESSDVTLFDYGDISRQVLMLDFRKLGYEQWLSLSRLSTKNGCLSAAFRFRENAIKKILLFDLNKSNTNEELYLKASLEANQLDYNFIIKKQRNHLLYSYVQGMIARPPEFPAQSSRDIDFFSFLKGKSIAIIGPAPSENQQGCEVDTFDIVARVSFSPDLGSSTHNDIYGSKTSLAYYGNYFSDLLIHQRDIAKQLKSIKYICLKSEEYKTKLQKSDLSSSSLRTFWGAKHLFLSGSPMMIQNILHDVLSCQPSRVKVFNTTFYLDDQNHRPGYYFGENVASMPDYDRFNLYSGFAHHDFISNFIFVKNLYVNGLIEADRLCESILKLSVEEYVLQLERKYFNKTALQLVSEFKS